MNIQSGIPKRRSFADGIAEAQEYFEYRRIVDDEDREAIFRLRYDAYRREGSISENPLKLSYDDYDDEPNAHQFGLYVAGELAAAIRVHVISPEHSKSPSMSVFPETLEPMIERGNTLIDPTRFVAREDFSKLFPELPYVTLRMPVMASLFYDADYCLASVRPEHAAFYRRVFKSKLLDGPKTYRFMTMPIVLLAAEVDRIRDTVLDRYPFFKSHYLEKRMMFTPGIWPSLPHHGVPDMHLGLQ